MWVGAALQCLCVEQGTSPSRSGGSHGSGWRLAPCLPGLCQPAKPAALRLGPRGHGVSWSGDSREALCRQEREGGAGFMVDAGRKGTVRRGERSLHLLEGDDGTGWGRPNAHKAGFQGGKPSCQQTACFPWQFGAPAKLHWTQTGFPRSSAFSSVPGEPYALRCPFA